MGPYMNLSMKFLQIYLSDYDVFIELNQCSNPFFESVQVWSPYKELTANSQSEYLNHLERHLNSDWAL